MSTKICDKCYKAAAILIPVEMGTSFATAKFCPACFERIYGKEDLEEALKALEDQESKKPDHLSQRRIAVQPGAQMGRRIAAGMAFFLAVSFGSLVLLGKLSGIDVWKPAGWRGFTLFAASAIAGVLAYIIIKRL